MAARTRRAVLLVGALGVAVVTGVAGCADGSAPAGGPVSPGTSGAGPGTTSGPGSGGPAAGGTASPSRTAVGPATSAASTGGSPVGPAVPTTGSSPRGTPTRPGQVPVALDGWALTLPVEGDQDAALTLPAARLSPPWLRRNDDGSLTFWAPVDGATTRGSSFARTELRETIRPGDTSVNWARQDPARLDATLRVERLPQATRKIVVGQIHGYNVEKKEIGPLLLLYVVDGDLVVSLRDTPTGDGQIRSTVARGLRPGNPFSYTVDVRDAVVRVRVDGVERFRGPVQPAWDGVGLYFKAGVYLQAKDGDRSDGGRVTFTALRVRH